MLGNSLVQIFCLFWVFPALVLSATPSSLGVSFRTRNLPGHSDEDTFLAIRRRFAAVASRGTFVANSSSSLDASWENLPLFSYGNNVHVSCTRCYIRGVASVQAAISDNNFNLTQAIDSLETQIGDEIDNLTSTAIDAVTDFIGDFVEDVITFNVTADSFSFDDYSIDTDFNIEMPPLPECSLKFTFDGLELYLQMGIFLNGTYTIPIFKSQSPFGISFGSELEMGVFLAVDLILSANSGLDIESGFHIKFEDGILFEIAMFGKNVSNVALNGASFEFLPVTVSINDVTFKAVLRVGIRAGIQISTPRIDVIGPITLDFLKDMTAGTGVEVGVYAHVAELVTDISAPANENNLQNNCRLAMRQEYTLGIGAAAGATVRVMDNTWGPRVATTTPIFYTTMVDGCAGSGTPIIPATITALQVRQGLETTTTTTKVKYTAEECKQAGEINCPMSLLRTVVQEMTLTLSTAVPSGDDVDWNSVLSATATGGVGAKAVEFGSAVQKFGATSGIPTSWVPPSETGSGSGGFGPNVDSAVGGLSTTNKTIIGASVGGGVTLLIALALGIWCCRRKRHTQELGASGSGVVTAGGYTSSSSGQQQMGYYNGGSKPAANVTVYPGR